MENYEPYGKEWEKELKKRPKDFLVNFIRNYILKTKELENLNKELTHILTLNRIALRASYHELTHEESMNKKQVVDSIESSIINIEEILHRT